MQLRAGRLRRSRIDLQSTSLTIGQVVYRKTSYQVSTQDVHYESDCLCTEQGRRVGRDYFSLSVMDEPCNSLPVVTFPAATEHCCENKFTPESTVLWLSQISWLLLSANISSGTIHAIGGCTATVSSTSRRKCFPICLSLGLKPSLCYRHQHCVLPLRPRFQLRKNQ